MQNIEQAGLNLLPAIAYGDAAGLPVETWTVPQIKAHYGWLHRLEIVTGNPYFGNENRAGVWSDDTQLSMAVAKAITVSGTFDIQAQATAFVDAYNETPRIQYKGQLVPRGWGGSTTNAAKRIAEGVSPLESGELGGAGNGVVMKLAPLVYWQAAQRISDADRYDQYDKITTMTHDSDTARWASRVHGDILHSLLTSDVANTPDYMAAHIIATARKHEVVLGIQDQVSDCLQYLLQADALDQEYILKHTDAKGFYVPQTLAMVYGVFLRQPKSLEQAVYMAVNMGGDTDSTASIIAGMFNFYKKGDVLLPGDVSKLQDLRTLQSVSRALTQVALKGAK